MALALPLGLSVSALISIIVSGGRAIYTTYDHANSGVGMIKSEPSCRCLYHCSAISDILQQIDKRLLQSEQGQKVVQDLVNCIEWSLEYEDKWLIQKIFLSNGYTKKFEKLNKLLFQSYDYFILSNLLLKFYPNTDLYKHSSSFTDITIGNIEDLFKTQPEDNDNIKIE